jgi:leukotriene-A4 hydrolase
LFNQCEDIACRSVAPMQDTPAIKITYEAKVLVKNEFVAMMSANKTKMEVVNDTHNAYFFESNI